MNRGSSPASVKRGTPGFTLIELMVTVAIAGILAAVAYPSYVKSVQKGHRGSAQAYLLDLVQRQQQYFTDNRAYAPDVATLNDPLPSEVSPYYTVAIASGTIAAPAQTTPPAFAITATAIGTQVSDGNLQVDSTGAKTPSSAW